MGRTQSASGYIPTQTSRAPKEIAALTFFSLSRCFPWFTGTRLDLAARKLPLWAALTIRSHCAARGRIPALAGLPRHRLEMLLLPYGPGLTTGPGLNELASDQALTRSIT